MNHEAFKAAVYSALHEARLADFGFHRETLDLKGLDRTHSFGVEPVGGQDAEPFHVTATISWRWDVFHAARTHTCEEDLLVELHGRESAYEMKTAKLRLRVDVKLRATLMIGHEIAMPSASAWRAWAEEVTARLEGIEPLVVDEDDNVDDEGNLAILAWQGEPEAKVLVGPDGDLKLSAVKVAAFQLIDVPRVLDDPDSEPDADPRAQLLALFHRVKASLHGWMESLDHLVP